MGAILALIGGMATAFAGLFILFMIAPLAGAIAGFMVGLVFEPTIRNTFMAFGVDLEGIQMWQLGMTLGFVGMFLKTGGIQAKSTTVEKKEKS